MCQTQYILEVTHYGFRTFTEHRFRRVRRMSRREKKNRNEEQTMRDNLKVGDEVVTIGGILGKVVSVKDETVVLETGADRNKIRFTKAAIATNASANARAQADKEAKEAAKAKEKVAKKEGKKKD